MWNFTVRSVAFLITSCVVSGCFLNSCPYRRYGKSLRCSTCGPEAKGICVEENRCCTSDECFAAAECYPGTVCPATYCRVGSSPGFCLSSAICCSNERCQKSMMCV